MLIMDSIKLEFSLGRSLTLSSKLWGRSRWSGLWSGSNGCITDSRWSVDHQRDLLVKIALQMSNAES